MIQFIITYEVEDRAGFYNALKEEGILEANLAEEGCWRYEYYASMDDEKCLIALENWRSLEDQQAHMKLPHFEKIMRLEKVYGAKPSIKVHECSEIAFEL